MDPFEFEKERHLQMSQAWDDPGIEHEGDQLLAEALDVLRYSSAFTLTAVGGNGKLISMTIGRKVTEVQMLELFCAAIDQAETNRARSAYRILGQALGFDTSGDDDS